MKILKNYISSQLSEISNISFSSRVFPSILRTAKFISVHKRDSKLYLSCSCPISLLTSVEVILKRLMYIRIYKLLNNNNLIYPLNFAFSQKYSTVHALISYTKNSKKNLDEGSIGFGIFVDLQKVFNTVEHDHLLLTLKHYGVCGLENEWFKYYLLNKKTICFNQWLCFYLA